MLNVHDLTKEYPGKTAVSSISFRVESGEIMGFLGPNGAGKTTTLRMITGFLAPTSGTISVDGIDAHESPAAVKRRIGYLPEGVPMYPEMRVSEYLRYRGALKEIAKSGLKEAVDQALERAAITDVRDRVIGQLSKGYRQRVGLADALLADPPLLVLDEPTSGLDPNQIRHFRELIHGFRGEKTVLLSTHILSEVEASCEKVIVIHEGKIVGGGTPENLREELLGGQVMRLVGPRPNEGPTLSDVVGEVDGVQSVELLDEDGGSLQTLRVQATADDAIADRIFQAVAQAGLSLRELKVEETSLESVFADLTTTSRDKSTITTPIDRGRSIRRRLRLKWLFGVEAEVETIEADSDEETEP